MRQEDEFRAASSALNLYLMLIVGIGCLAIITFTIGVLT